VLRLLAEGLTNAQLADRLSISPSTVSSHLERIFAKLDVTTRGAAVAIAHRHGIADTG
jgi:DNA-binding CsgD family transcriptional regulator